MDKKKLIGTIIGVIMFALLIAGATYAWLTLAANVTNGNYGVGTKNFIINYVGGTTISNTVQTTNATTSEITSETLASADTDGWLAVTASKNPTSAKASDFTIKLYIDSSTLTTKALTYAVCKGECPTNVALATVAEGIATCGVGVTACGTINGNQSRKDVILYTDNDTFNREGDLNNNETIYVIDENGDYVLDDNGQKVFDPADVITATYNIYFWLDSGTLDAADIGRSFNGYIHASATQGD